MDKDAEKEQEKTPSGQIPEQPASDPVDSEGPGPAQGSNGSARKEPPAATPKLDVRFWLAFWSVCLCNLTAALDSTTLAVSIPAISEELNGDEVEAFWAGTAYLLSSTSLLLLWTSLSDAFGRRPVFLVALLILLAGSIVCAVAQNYTVLIAGRAIQGIGSGAILGVTGVIITDLAPLKERGRLYAFSSLMWAVGSMTGPIIGGACARSGQWRWIFWLNLPIVALGFAGVALFLKLNRRAESLSFKLRRLDYAGSVLFIAAVTSFLMPITWGGTQFPWGSWHTVVPIVIGAAGLVALAFYERRVAKVPFIPLHIFLNYSTSILFFGCFIHGLILFTFMFYMPEYFQTVQGYDPLMSGVTSFPQTLTVVPCALFVGVVVSKTGKYRWAIWTGWALLTFGCGILILFDVDTSVPAWIFMLALPGLGIGLLFISMLLAIQSSIPQVDVAMASTLVVFFRSFGQAVGVAVGSAILNNRMQVELSSSTIAPLLPADLGDVGAVALVDALKALPADSPLAIALKGALARSFRVIWATGCGLAGLTMLAHIPLKAYDMNQEHVTEHGWAQQGPAGQTESGVSNTESVLVDDRG